MTLSFFLRTSTPNCSSKISERIETMRQFAYQTLALPSNNNKTTKNLTTFQDVNVIFHFSSSWLCANVRRPKPYERAGYLTEASKQNKNQTKTKYPKRNTKIRALS